MTSGELLADILRCTERNSALHGDELVRAADAVSAIAETHDAFVVNVDDAGARIVGACLARHDQIRTVDRSRRADMIPVLLVAGHIAGTMQVALAAQTLRRLGAVSVVAAVLSAPARTIPLCDEVMVLPSEPLRVVAAS